MEIFTLDIKSDMPPASVACANLEIEIERLSKTNIKLIKVIHGYGSHGVGGKIKRQMNTMLLRLLHDKKIKNFVNGEKLNEEFIKNNLLYENYPQLILDADLKNYNSGVSLIFLN